MRRAIAILAAAVTLPLGAARCAPGGSLPVHTRTYWLTREWPAGSVVVVQRGTLRPLPHRVRGRVIPGAWQKRGRTYTGGYVFEWRPGHPNGH